MKKITLALLLSVALPVNAATVAVVDSGTDFQHEMLAGNRWTNAKEIPGNLVDDDGNGKVDDVDGWNFVDQYSSVFYPEHLAMVHPITFQLMTVIAHKQDERATPEEIKFWDEKVMGLPKADKDALVAHLNFYGQYAHGTHCSGIVKWQAPNAKIFSARVFPDTPPAEYSPKMALSPMMASAPSAKSGVMDYVYKFLATLTNGTFDSVGLYLNEQKADVANYSLGVGLPMIAKAMLQLRGVKAPTPEQVQAETQRIFKQFEAKGRAWMASSPGTLFVVAAGNDGSDNDKLPMFPASIRVDNAITVAAVHMDGRMAKFSNYGLTSVDVAAPGVAVNSAVPALDRKQMLPMSGTSMAAPYVSGVAARIKDENPKLTPLQLKTILMKTVDKKDALKGKVVSGGIVNADRAAMAARSSLSMPLDQAIATAMTQVADVELPPIMSKPMEKSARGIIDELADSLVF